MPFAPSQRSDRRHNLYYRRSKRGSFARCRNSRLAPDSAAAVEFARLRARTAKMLRAAADLVHVCTATLLRGELGSPRSGLSVTAGVYGELGEALVGGELLGTPSGT